VIRTVFKSELQFMSVGAEAWPSASQVLALLLQIPPRRDAGRSV
jgi:hypothetical protein